MEGECDAGGDVYKLARWEQSRETVVYHELDHTLYNEERMMVAEKA